MPISGFLTESNRRKPQNYSLQSDCRPATIMYGLLKEPWATIRNKNLTKPIIAIPWYTNCLKQQIKTEK